MKPAILILLFLLLPAYLFAQYKKKFVFKYAYCGFNRQPTMKTIAYEDGGDEIRTYVDMICREAGINNDFELKKSPIKTALATMSDRYHRIIFYSAEFFRLDSINQDAIDERKFLILAHEIGHFLNNNILHDDQRRLQDELDADHFAGTMLCKISLSLTTALQYMTDVCDNYEGLYPSLQARKKALTDGFHESGCKVDYEIPRIASSEVVELFLKLHPNTIFFEFDSSVLGTRYYPTLDALSAELRASSKSILLKGYFADMVEGVDGHYVTATDGQALTLSRNMAIAVRTYLMNSGVEAKRIKIKAFGNTAPLAGNDSELGRSLNRRVDFEFVSP